MGSSRLGIWAFHHRQPFKWRTWKNSPAQQRAELQLQLEEELGGRVRAAIHLCLSAASVAVEVGHALMDKFSEISGEERAALLARCAEDAQAASDAAHHAAAVLAQEEPPETDAFFEIS